ncbi:MAG: adenylate/guanylate cyclase domain-containing protein, partial [Dehalococcoidia bacterium]
MNCPKCSTTNPEGAKFCMSCGNPLALACANCGADLPAEAQFCFVCGQKVGAPVTAPAESAQQRISQYIPTELLAKLESARTGTGMQGERRVVTMLFCDVKGSTAAAEKLDPEEWAEIMNGAFEHLISPVYTYEGTLARLMGDAILAFFGAPIAHEDDPQRAVLAGLGILDAIAPYKEQVRAKWGFDFDVRVGINTGLVVVGEVGSDLRVEYTALGDAVNLAARMEQTATPGTVQISDQTHKLIAPLFHFEDLGSIEVKGKEEPVKAFRVLQPKGEPGRLRGIEGLDSPLIGRAHEAELLRQAIEDLRRGTGRIVSLMGEAGLGKSRLAAEARNEALAQPGIDWYEGRCLSYRSTTPYSPFIALFTKLLALTSDAPNEERFAQLRQRLATAVPDGGEDLAPFLGTMLGLDLPDEFAQQTKYLEPQELKDRIFGAVKGVVGRLASTKPTVLVFEDLHWSDPTSVELLQELMPSTDTCMLMLLAAFRPGRTDPSWTFHETAERDFDHRHTSIELKPLDDEQTGTLVHNLLSMEGMPAELRELILARTEGNPFFVEEVIRSLLESDVITKHGDHWHVTGDIDTIAVPNTLTGVLTTRLDQLDEASKRVAQTASVIGREFSLEALAAIAGQEDDLEATLTSLQRRGLVRETARVPRRTFVFKHSLTQDTAYGSLLLSRRRELHRQAADWMV